MKKYFRRGHKTGPYFEGWYFKCQALDGRSLALIPAFHTGEHGEQGASVQVITEDRAWYLEYPASSFSASGDALPVEIDGNCFSEEGLLLNVEQRGLSLHGRLHFGPFLPLKSDIMGPFRWFANMECAHSVISMEHTLQGRLELNGCILDFGGGTGYAEADRGRSFPSAYLWTQCRWPDCSLMLSIAAIPLGKLRFTGCICAIVLNGQEYRLATYRGAKIQSWSSKGAILRQRKHRLEVELLEQKAQPLRAPAGGSMSRTVHESLCAKVRYRLWRGKTLLLDHVDDHAGFEYAQICKAEDED